MALTTAQRAALLGAATAHVNAISAVPVDAPPAPPPPPPAPVPEPPPPAPPPPPPAPPPPNPSVPALYFSPSGNVNAAGTFADPKRDLVGVNVNTLAAGTALRFQRGGTYLMTGVRLFNPAATPDARLTYEAYGVGPRPILQFGSGQIGIEFGRNFGDTVPHGGYAFRGVNVRGDAVDGSWGFWLKKNISDVLIDDCEVSNWGIGINAQGGDNTTRLHVLNSNVRDNFAMGVLGCFYESLFQGIDFSGDRLPRSHFDHLLYLRGGDRNVVRGNRLLTDQPARGGTLTLHGFVPTSLVLEDNDFRYGPGSDEGAWVISLIPDNGSVSGGWNGLIVRRNTVQNAGNNGIHIEAAPGAIVEDNTSIVTVARAQTAIGWVDDPSRPNDLKGGGTMRGNRAIGPAGSSMTFAAPAGTAASNNLYVST